VVANSGAGVWKGRDIGMERSGLAVFLQLTYTPATGCCTQALLFPRSSAVVTVNYLNNSRCKKGFAKDSALDDMLNDLQMTAYLVQPNTFTHIGLYSALRDHIVDPLQRVLKRRHKLLLLAI